MKFQMKNVMRNFHRKNAGKKTYPGNMYRTMSDTSVNPNQDTWKNTYPGPKYRTMPNTGHTLYTRGVSPISSALTKEDEERMVHSTK